MNSTHTPRETGHKRRKTAVHAQRVAWVSAAILGANQAGEAVRKIDAVLRPDLEVAAADAPLRMTRRKSVDGEVWFVVNDGRKPWSGPVTLPVPGTVQVCDPVSGSICEEPGPSVNLVMAPYGAVVLRARTTASARDNAP